MVKLIDGLSLAEKIKLGIRQEIINEAIEPQLAVVLVGDDPASHLYVSLKEKACLQVGIGFHKYFLPATADQKQIEETIGFLNNDDSIDAILVQLPLPASLDTNKIIALIDPAKDADGFGPVNIKNYLAGQPSVVPVLEQAIETMLLSTGEDLNDKQAVVISNSEVFAKPIISMLKKHGTTGVYANPNTTFQKVTKKADVIIIAAGHKYLLGADDIKKNSIVIDIGINKIEGKIYGDVNPEVDDLVAYRSPVPGGIGPLTVAMLLKNTLALYKQKVK